MNKLKARTADGKTVLLSVRQRTTPTYVSKGQVYGGDASKLPAQVKARALRMGLVLTGKRQGA
jgi:hypothetical protein